MGRSVEGTLVASRAVFLGIAKGRAALAKGYLKLAQSIR